MAATSDRCPSEVPTTGDDRGAPSLVELVDQLQSRATDWQQSYDESQGVTRQLLGEITARHRSLRQREQQLEQRLEELRQREQPLQQNQQELERRLAELEELECALREAAETNSAKSQEAADAKAGRLNKREGDLDSKLAELDARHSELESRQATLAHREQQLEELLRQTEDVRQQYLDKRMDLAARLRKWRRTRLKKTPVETASTFSLAQKLLPFPGLQPHAEAGPTAASHNAPAAAEEIAAGLNPTAAGSIAHWLQQLATSVAELQQRSQHEIESLQTALALTVQKQVAAETQLAERQRLVEQLQKELQQRFDDLRRGDQPPPQMASFSQPAAPSLGDIARQSRAGTTNADSSPSPSIPDWMQRLRAAVDEISQAEVGGDAPRESHQSDDQGEIEETVPEALQHSAEDDSDPSAEAAPGDDAPDQAAAASENSSDDALSDWEDRKRQVLAQYGMLSGNDDPAKPVAPSKPAGTSMKALLEEAVAPREPLVEACRRRDAIDHMLPQESAKPAKPPEPPAAEPADELKEHAGAIPEAVVDDAQITEMRSQLQERMRQAEVEMSIERARLARQRMELEEKIERIEKSRRAEEAKSASDNQAGWLARFTRLIAPQRPRLSAGEEPTAGADADEETAAAPASEPATDPSNSRGEEVQGGEVSTTSTESIQSAAAVDDSAGEADEKAGRHQVEERLAEGSNEESFSQRDDHDTSETNEIDEESQATQEFRENDALIHHDDADPEANSDHQVNEHPEHRSGHRDARPAEESEPSLPRQECHEQDKVAAQIPETPIVDDEHGCSEVRSEDAEPSEGTAETGDNAGQPQSRQQPTGSRKRSKPRRNKRRR